MDTFPNRLRAAMATRGALTPDELAEVCNIPRKDAVMLMGLSELPPIFLTLSRVAEMLVVRMTWLTTGRSVMSSDKTLHPFDREALEILGRLDPEAVHQWLECGRKLTAAPKSHGQ